MHVNIRDLLSKEGSVQLSGDTDCGHLFQQESDGATKQPLHIELTAQADSGIAQLSGTLTLLAEFVCSRCLCHYGQRLSIPFRERFTRNNSQSGDDEDDELHVVDEEVVDLIPYIEENVLLGMPYITVCMTECKGLNPETGANLNVDPTALPEARIDPRLAVLQQWLDKKDT